MAFSKCKGTVLKLDISSVLTAIAQVISVDLPEDEASDFEALTLDQAGVGMPREMTGYTDSNGFAAELFYDPALSPHTAIRTNHIATPAKSTWQIILADAGTTTIDFTIAGLKFKAEVAAADGLKASMSGNLDGIPTHT